MKRQDDDRGLGYFLGIEEGVPGAGGHSAHKQDLYKLGMEHKGKGN